MRLSRHLDSYGATNTKRERKSNQSPMIATFTVVTVISDSFQRLTTEDHRTLLRVRKWHIFKRAIAI